MSRIDFRPETADSVQHFKQNTGQDPARYLVPDENLYHKRPSLQSGDDVFVWPIGVEGLHETGTATVAIHHYFGDSNADVQVIHRDESRIEMSGTFPGIKGIKSARSLRGLCRQPTIEPGKILYLPGIYERVQYVTVENYDFTHSADDRTHSWDYTITFIRGGAGKRIPDPHGTPAPPNPGRKKKHRGKKKLRVKHVKSGTQTIRQIAKEAYGNAEKWTLLADLNADLITSAVNGAGGQGIPYFEVPNYRWPLGTEIAY